MAPSWLETPARVIVTRFFERFIVTGCLILVEEGGTKLTFQGERKHSNVTVILQVHTPQFYWKVATEADLGFADAYINGDFSFVDKSEGLLNLFMIFITNTELNTYNSKLNKIRGWWSPLIYTSIISSAKCYLKHVWRQNTITQARRNISFHYELSNELFSLFLDETMSYSCPIFKTPNEDLKSAQLRKIHTLVEKARISKDHHVLDIGCGWGSLAFEVVNKTGCKYTGITLSEKQLQYVEFKVNEAGLQDNIQLLLCDYRQLPNNCKYDRIISCVVHLEEIGRHFFHTLRRWRENFLQNQRQVLALGFDEKFIRTWEYYLEYCAAGFKLRLLGNYQIVFSRPGDVAAFGDVQQNLVDSAY